jgi:hypothetical protein
MSVYDLIKTTNILTVRQGKDNTGTVTLTQTVGGAAVDLTGATVRGQVRTLDGTLGATMTCTLADDPKTGVINYSLPLLETAKLTPATNISHVWGIEPTIGGEPIEEVHGGMMVEPEVVT